MSNNTTADVTGIFSLDTNRLVGLAAKGSPDVTYLAGQDTPTSGIPLTITLTSDGGIGDLAVGDQELSVLARPGVNRLLKIQPTRVATPYSESNTAQYTTFLQGDAVTDIDLDACDPDYAPGVGTPVPGGLSYREAHLAMEMIGDTRKMVSMEVVEVNPIIDEANRTGLLAVELVLSAMGKRIL